MRRATTNHNHPKRATKSHNKPQPPKTSRNEPQWPTTSHSKPQWPTTSHNEPQWPTASHNDLQRATTSHNDLLQPSQKSPNITYRYTLCFIWCGSLWVIVAHCGLLWVVVAWCGWLWFVVAFKIFIFSYKIWSKKFFFHLLSNFIYMIYRKNSANIDIFLQINWKIMIHQGIKKVPITVNIWLLMVSVMTWKIYQTELDWQCNS